MTTTQELPDRPLFKDEITDLHQSVEIYVCIIRDNELGEPPFTDQACVAFITADDRAIIYHDGWGETSISGMKLYFEQNPTPTVSVPDDEHPNLNTGGMAPRHIYDELGIPDDDPYVEQLRRLPEVFEVTAE